MNYLSILPCYNQFKSIGNIHLCCYTLQFYWNKMQYWLSLCFTSTVTTALCAHITAHSLRLKRCSTWYCTHFSSSRKRQCSVSFDVQKLLYSCSLSSGSDVSTQAQACACNFLWRALHLANKHTICHYQKIVNGRSITLYVFIQVYAMSRNNKHVIYAWKSTMRVVIKCGFVCDMV